MKDKKGTLSDFAMASIYAVAGIGSLLPVNSKAADQQLGSEDAVKIIQVLTAGDADEIRSLLQNDSIEKLSAEERGRLNEIINLAAKRMERTERPMA